MVFHYLFLRANSYIVTSCTNPCLRPHFHPDEVSLDFQYTNADFTVSYYFNAELEVYSVPLHRATKNWSAADNETSTAPAYLFWLILY